MQFFRDFCSGQKFLTKVFDHLLSTLWGKPVEISQRVKARATKNFRPEAG
jgi:hypothetical protein